MLQSKSLWFSRADLLGDPYEGSITAPIFEEENILAAKKLVEADAEAERKAEEKINRRKLAVKNMHINCWHMNERESAAMWGLYGNQNESIAIVSTCQSLCECLPGHISIGTVNYIDYETHKFDPKNLYNPFVNKRSSFSHENELRAVLWDAFPYLVGVGQNNEKTKKSESDFLNESYRREGGASVPVKIDKLIKSIYINPASPAWYKKVIEELCMEYDLDTNVYQSDMLRDALF